MARLISVADMISRFGFDTGNMALSNALGVAIDNATVSLSSMIRTSFDPVTGQTDYFAPRAPLHNGEFLETKFKLTQGFIDPSSVVITYDSSIADILAGDGTILTLNIFIDQNKGQVVVYDTDFTGTDPGIRRYVPSASWATSGVCGAQYVQIVYNAGFQVVDNVYQGTPDWLVNAAAAQSLVLLDEDFFAYRADRASGPQDLLRRKAQIERNLIRYVRYLPNAEVPIGI